MKKQNHSFTELDKSIDEFLQKRKEAGQGIKTAAEAESKQAAEALFNDLGLNMSSAITMFLKSAVSHDGIPFEVKRKVPNPDTAAALAEYHAMKKNPDSYKRYSSFAEIMDEVLEDA